MAEHPDHWTKKALGVDPAAIKALQDRIPGLVDSYLEKWRGAMTDAVAELPATSDATQAYNTRVALAGNMLWAATSLNPPSKALVMAMSFTGAYIGSGELAVSDDVPIKHLHDQIYKAHDKLLSSFSASAGKLASKIVASGTTDHKEQDQIIWNAIYNGIPLNQDTPILEKARQAVHRAFAQFEGLHTRWLDETYKEGQAQVGLPPDDMGRNVTGPMKQWNHDVAKAVEKVRKAKPFKPNFAF